VAVGRLQAAEQRAEGTVDGRELLGQWPGMVADGFEAVRDGGDTASGVE
jgi:hypothetical protein